MPAREVQFSTGFYYHVFNKSVPDLELFLDERYYSHMQFTFWYYRISKPTLRLSKYLDKSKEVRDQLRIKWKGLPSKVNILSYCLMPNHYHLLIKQQTENGIVEFMNMIQNSYAHYYNTRKKRQGPVFIGRFKAVMIESNAQLLQVSRYIHLNPVTAYITKTVGDLDNYNWSSWNEYRNQPIWFPICDPTEVLSQFKSFQDYRDFCAGYVDYERELKYMQKLVLDV